MKVRRIQNGSELYHHGVKGQKWGVRNGPPYPITKISKKKDAKEVDEVYNTLTPKQKRQLQGFDDNEKMPNELKKHFVTQKDYDQSKVEHYVLKMKDVPISVLDIWNEDEDSAAVSIMTRNGPEYRNKGYATKLVKEGLKWYEQSDIKNLYWDVRSDNEASKNLAIKSGFKKDQNYKENGWETYVKRK